MKEEKIENNEQEVQMVAKEENNYQVMGFDELGRNTNTKTEVITNIKDSKKLFNLENNVDTLLNDCEGETIRVKEVLIKRYEKPLKEPIINEDTGEVLKDKEISMSCVLVDDEGKSYATGSKIFAIQLMRYLQVYAKSENAGQPFDIKIFKKKYGEKGNKALSFELV
nr:MAG TPA: Single stranded DNA binding protein [Caudoviricetes sp.]